MEGVLGIGVFVLLFLMIIGGMGETEADSFERKMDLEAERKKVKGSVFKK